MAQKHIDNNSLKHFSVCFAASLLLGVFGAALSVGASLCKEYCDKHYYGHWCWWDIAFDALGIVIGTTIHFVVLGLII